MRSEKTCSTCGRRITWRKKWADCWVDVRHCSDACRKAKPGQAGIEIEAVILRLLADRKTGATICPSEAARMMWPDAWQDRMEEVRRAARRLAGQGLIEITQNGRSVDPSTAKGPIRVRRLC